eukprot:scaffold13751_cov108-Isochrysis_galbana.AAC.4
MACNSRARRPGERDDVADVCHSSGVSDEALEANAEPGVLLRAVPAQVEHVQPLLALRAAHHLSQPWEEHVHRGDRLRAVLLGLPLVDAHVKGLALLGVVVYDDRLLEDSLCQVALVLRLELLTPDGRVLPHRPLLGTLGRSANLDCLCVGDALEGRAGDVLQRRDELLVVVLLQER